MPATAPMGSVQDLACELVQHRIQAMVEDVDQGALAMERKWGIDRLRLLVPVELRARFDAQKNRLDQAIASNLEDYVRVHTQGMSRAWEAVDRAAAEAGNSPLRPEVWELTLAGTGEVVSLVRTEAEAHLVVAPGRVLAGADRRADRKREVRNDYWTRRWLKRDWLKLFPCSACRVWKRQRRGLTALLWFLWLQPGTPSFSGSRRARTMEGYLPASPRDRAPRQTAAGILLMSSRKLNHQILHNYRRFLVERTDSVKRDVNDRYECRHLKVGQSI